MPRIHRPSSGDRGNPRPIPWLLRQGVSTLWATAWVLLLTTPAYAASIGVSPTLIAVNAGESVSGLRISNGDLDKSVSVQLRIVRWQQDASGDVYTPTESVAISPPFTHIEPGSENLVRIVRTTPLPLAGEESYRLLVDELPESGAQQAGTISLMVRHSVPVFFSSTNATPAQPQWQIGRAQQNGTDGWRVTVINHGDKRLRLANLDIRDHHGTLVAQHSGLLGYVLGHSRMSFFVARMDTSANVEVATTLRLSVKSEYRAIDTGLLPVASSPSD